MFSDFPIFPEVASSIAGRVDALYFFITAVGLFFFTLICVLVLVFAVKYRRRSLDERPAPIHGSLKLELLWTIIPLILAMVMFVWGARLYVDIYTPPSDALNIYVVGKQWMWKIQHPEGNREINELHVPVGTPVKLIMTSEDVIHSFYIPAFRIKMDVLPGRYTSVWFEATKPGKYHLFCAEYCGTKHSEMIGSVYALEPTEYQDWLGRTAGASPSMVEAGEELFAQLGCPTCHASDSGARGPDLTGLYGSTVTLLSGEIKVADDAYIRKSIVDPTSEITQGYAPLMPTYKGQVDEEDLLKLVAYLKSMALDSSHSDATEKSTKGPLEANE